MEERRRKEGGGGPERGWDRERDGVAEGLKESNKSLPGWGCDGLIQVQRGAGVRGQRSSTGDLRGHHGSESFMGPTAPWKTVLTDSSAKDSGTSTAGRTLSCQSPSVYAHAGHERVPRDVPKRKAVVGVCVFDLQCKICIF